MTSKDEHGREEPLSNFVATDQIWKDHVWREETAAKLWQPNWGFLKTDLKELVKDEFPEQQSLEEQLKNKPAVTVKSVTPLEQYIRVEPSPMPVPKTTSQFIGWRSADPKCVLEKYGRYAKPKGGLVKQLNWPPEAVE